jgi:hypothetical protein
MYIYLHNKYTKWYYGIIQSAQNRRLDPGTRVEKHHIIPRSLGGGNEVTNLVALTLREHYVCHLLLTKMCTDKALHKMIHAAWYMARTRKGIRVPSRTYEVLKEKATKLISEASKERAKRLGTPKGGFRGKTHSAEAIEKMCEASKNKWQDPEMSQKMSAGMKKAAQDMTPEERSARAKKGWETRRLNVHAALNHSVTGTAQNLQ